MNTGPFHGMRRNGTGKWVNFGVNTTRLVVQLLTRSGLKVGVVECPKQLGKFFDTCQRGENSYFVGIYEASYYEPAIKDIVPACVVPQLATTGDAAFWSLPGDTEQFRLTIPATSLTHLSLISDLKYLPTKRVFDENMVIGRT